MIYSRSIGKPSINWYEALETPYRDKKKWKELYELSKQWDSCPMGQESDFIPRDESGAPRDKELLNLSYEFTKALREVLVSYGFLSYKVAVKKAWELFSELTNKAEDMEDELTIKALSMNPHLLEIIKELNSL